MVDAKQVRPLGDTPERSYASKLSLFAQFAEPELRRVIDDLGVQEGDCVLDAGCGVAHATQWLGGRAGPMGAVIGLDLSMPHLRSAPSPSLAHLVQGDLDRLCIRPGSIDWIWCCNAINHLSNPAGALRSLRAALRPGGQLALAQSSFLPEMYFAWDARLEDEVRRACYRYYREKYGLDHEDISDARRLVGLMLETGFAKVSVRTYVIERIQPLSETDRAYFRSAVFEGYWGSKLRPYLTDADWAALQALCDPGSAGFCLDRRDFHHVQTLTVVRSG